MTYEIALADVSEVFGLLAFLRARGIDADLAVPVEKGVIVEPATSDPAAIDVYVALHTWLERNPGSELNVKVDGRTFTLAPGTEAVA